MTSISFFPVATDEAQVIDLISRAAWFLSFSAADRIHLPVASESLKSVAWRVAPGMDPAIAGNFDALRSKLELVVATSADALEPFMGTAAVILRWKKDARPAFVPAARLVGWEKGKKVLQVDPVAIRQEGSYYIEAGLHLLRDRQSLIDENARKFKALASKLGRFKRAYLMATGPSVAGYRDFDYEGAITIVCNSVILDEALMSAVKPQILCFADPIFHFGPSQYAGAFRDKLRESVVAHDLAICIPFKYYALFISAMPELRDRTVALPFIKDRAFNFDLRSEFTLKTTANILTFLMVPLAATFADEVGIIGCDGRPLAENTYFWGHNPKTQINDKMANIREVHPGFFAIDYNDYYLEHCQTLETQFTEGEAQGKRFLSLGFSHIPALRSRSGRGHRAGIRGVAVSGAPEVVIVDPDALSWAGHYMAYNEKLAAALAVDGAQVRVLCHRKIAPVILEARPHFLPLLDTHSWFVGRAKAADPVLSHWSGEIAAALCSVPRDSRALLLYMYCGSLEHARALSLVVQRDPAVFVHVNLFWLSFRDLRDTAWVDAWRPFVQWLQHAGPRFVATVPTRELQADVMDAFGVILDVAPHPSTGVSDDQLGVPRPAKAASPGLCVLFPGAPRVEKGFQETLDCIRLLGDEPSLRVRLRHQVTTATPDALRLLPTDLPANAEVVAQALSDEEFGAFFASGDVVVLPYTPDGFAKRTSGLLIDAMHYGLPAVVVEGTWLAAVVRRYGVGVVAPDATPASLRDAIRTIAADHAGHVRSVRDGARRYFRDNTWQALARFITLPLQRPTEGPRLLAIDLTGFDGITATGRVKEALFHGWPAESGLLASCESATQLMRLNRLDGSLVLAPSDSEAVMAEIRRHAPQAIYYRAVDDDAVHAFAMKAITGLGLPYVVHLMDDWPERLRRKSPARFAVYDRDLRRLLAGARACLSISESMSAAFQARYGVAFRAFANAVDPAAFAPRSQSPKAQASFRIAYTGALAEDMNFQSVKDVAEALAGLQADRPVHLEIYTRDPWFRRAADAFAGNPAVRIHKSVPAADYYGVLQDADALLIAYNFDDATREYVRFSKANKLPEYLASGVPIIAYGPEGLATIDELSRHEAAQVVSVRGIEALAQAIDTLRRSPERARLLGARARALAFDAFNVWRLSGAFRAAVLGDQRPAPHAQGLPANLRPVSAMPTAPIFAGTSAGAPPVIGPFGRDAAAHWDETAAIAELFAGPLNGSVLVDVGAHHGSSLMPFLNKGWRVFAFEPDETNRGVLLGRLEGHRHADRIKLDTRAVSDKKSVGLPFFRSDQSTGISGLSAFHDSHVQSQTVDTVTLVEALADAPIKHVDFLKIDTEGHDLFVLKGFPWERFEPRVIECEFEDSKTIPLGYRFDELAAFLADKGYTVFVSEWHPIVRYGIRHDWHRLVRYPCKLADGAGWGNLLAFRQPIADSTLVKAVNRVLRLGDQKAKAPAAPAPVAARPPALPQVDASSMSTDRSLSPKVTADPAFTSTASGAWRYVPGAAASGKAQYWKASFPSTHKLAGRILQGSMCIVADRRTEVRVGLCRDGATAYEGSRVSVVLQPGVPRTVKLSHDFKGSHDAVRLHVELGETAAEVMLTITGLYLNETLASVLRRVPPASRTLAHANRLFREGDYPTAMGLYLLAGEQYQSLRLFNDNALACARRLGMPEPRDAKELKGILS